MKTKNIFAVLTTLSIVIFGSMSHAADIIATNSGNWGDPTIWQGGVVPGANDSADILAGINVTVTTNVTVQYIYDPGTVTMAPGSTLNVLDQANGTDGLGALVATAPGNTVIYSGNPYWAKECDYFNLVFSNTTFVPVPPFYPSQYFNNFSRHGATPMTIAGNMTVVGYTAVQQASGGAPINIDGNLFIGTNCAWDCSGDNLTVMGNTTVGGLLEDLNGALGNNQFAGNITINPGGLWDLGDVITWYINGNLTNNGLIVGKGYGSISFEGTGTIAGSKPLAIPAMTVDGTYTIGTTITLTTNTPTLNGTLVFDIAHTNQIVLLANIGTENPNIALFYSGNLNVINSGAPPASGASFTLFTCLNGFGGNFVSTSFPSLPNGLSWVDNTLTSGSIDVTGTLLGYPTLTLSRSGATLTLSWDSTTFPGYQVLALTNRSVNGTPWSSMGSGTISPFITTINPTNRAVFYRLSNP